MWERILVGKATDKNTEHAHYILHN